MQAFRIKKMERYLRKEETQVYVIGTRVPDFPSSFHLRRRIRYDSIGFVIKVCVLSFL